MESPRQADEGYPEEQPDDVAPESGHEPPKDDDERDDDSESGPEKATGNPRT